MGETLAGWSGENQASGLDREGGHLPATSSFSLEPPAELWLMGRRVISRFHH